MEIVKNTKRWNGLKDAVDLWRTFDGEHYVYWIYLPQSQKAAGYPRVAGYRAAGVKCRRVGAELFVSQADRDRAEAYDKANPEVWL